VVGVTQQLQVEPGCVIDEAHSRCAVPVGQTDCPADSGVMAGNPACTLRSAWTARRAGSSSSSLARGGRACPGRPACAAATAQLATLDQINDPQALQRVERIEGQPRRVAKSRSWARMPCSRRPTCSTLMNTLELPTRHEPPTGVASSSRISLSSDRSVSVCITHHAAAVCVLEIGGASPLARPPGGKKTWSSFRRLASVGQPRTSRSHRR